MKKIKIEVTLTVPNDFETNEPDWDIEDAVQGKYEYETRYLD